MQVARRGEPGPIEHLVDEDRRDLMTVANHLWELGARDGENLRGLLGDRVARWTDQAGVGKQPGDVPSRPLQHLVPPGATVHKNGDAAREHDEEPLHRRALRAQHVSLIEVPHSPM